PRPAPPLTHGTPGAASIPPSIRRPGGRLPPAEPEGESHHHPRHSASAPRTRRTGRPRHHARTPAPARRPRRLHAPDPPRRPPHRVRREHPHRRDRQRPPPPRLLQPPGRSPPGPLQQPPHHPVRGLRRGVPPRHLPPDHLRTARRQGRPRTCRRPPARLRHLHRTRLRPGPQPPHRSGRVSPPLPLRGAPRPGRPRPRHPARPGHLRL